MNEGEAQVSRRAARGLFGKDVRVRAPVHRLKAFSARAGQPALLVSACGFGKPPARVLMTHGEPIVAEAFALCPGRDFGLNVSVPAPAATPAWTAVAVVAPR
jgi:hypothetical protein